MKRIPLIGIKALVVCSIATVLSAASARRETPLVKAVRNSKTAVVNIHSEKTSYSSDTVFQSSKGRKVNGMGTGVVIDERGYIVTNHHVVDGVDLLRVTLVDGSTYEASVVSYDRKHDLAIIKIKPSEPLTVMSIGTSSDLMLGETVFAVGNAFGYEHTVTSGIVSSLSRDVEVNDTQSYYNLIQTDASINPGNSGGPLLNLDGEVVGINVAIRAGAQRIGFAIPIDQAREVIAELISVNEINQTHHGLVSQDIKTPNEKKLIVQGAETDSPAEKAGFKEGDVILSVGDVSVADRVDFERALLDKKPGDMIEVKYKREEEEIVTNLEVGKYDPSQVVRVNGDQVISRRSDKKTSTTLAERIWDELGVRVTPLPDNQTVTQGTIYEGGMRVTSIRAGGPASRGGIQPGDVIVGLHRWATVTTENIEYVLDQRDTLKDDSLKFFILRGRQPLHGKLEF
ncbi:MAG: trypsin-like peptidase domain-containing protein [Planctomycetaceae bacterium]|nr:trypsin-like peptidase domain-containing protein [Planctomycetaceae bacterium]